MQKIDLKEIIESKAPEFLDSIPEFLRGMVLSILNKILYIREVNNSLERFLDKKDFDFIDELFDYLDFSYNLSSSDKLRIPSEGRLIIVSNHPLGALDGLALLKAVGEVRKDVRIVANDILLSLPNLSNLFLPFDVFSVSSQKKYLSYIKGALENDEVIILFPAGEVSRLTLRGIKDRKWMAGAVKLAKTYNSPVLPFHIKARNSILFYLVSAIIDSMAIFMLAGQIFNKRGKTINLKAGNLIPAEVFSTETVKVPVLTKLLKRHVYRLGNNKSGIFKTVNTIIHPVDKKIIRKELNGSKLLGYTYDSKKIYLTDYEKTPNTIKEIARLREITFRKVGEGTGMKLDFDSYDAYYKHLVLWDEEELEIVGSYRIGICSEISAKKGIAGLYNSSLYSFTGEFNEILVKSIELGRSFIQQKYWRSSALDYMWQGIAAFLSEYPGVRYLFGAVSISNSYNPDAQAMIVYFYKKWYSHEKNLANATERYIVPKLQQEHLAGIMGSDNYEEDFKSLKTALKNFGYSVPVLFKKYTELCNYGGVKFMDFGRDNEFKTIDGLMLLDLEEVKPEKRKRYYSAKSFA